MIINKVILFNQWNNNNDNDNYNNNYNNRGDAANLHRNSIRLDTTGWARWSTGNCARNLNSTIQTNGTCTNQHLSLGMRHINSYGILT